MKLNSIKNIQDFREYNIICTTTEEVKECLEMLNKGKPFKPEIYKNTRIVNYREDQNYFESDTLAYYNKDISFLNFKKIYNKLRKQEEEKQKLPDFETDENGRVIKINNWNSDIKLYTQLVYTKICSRQKDTWERDIKIGFVFDSEEALNNYIKYLTIHTQLKNLANRLNNGEKIDWNNNFQDKYYLYFFNYDSCLGRNTLNNCKDNNIFCLDEKFKDEAIKEIGEENLKWYLQQSY